MPPHAITEKHEGRPFQDALETNQSEFVGAAYLLLPVPAAAAFTVPFTGRV
jgi:hypothetical protein